ncbi:hypothetical protein ACFFRR_001164 [Megaselia abdita]
MVAAVINTNLSVSKIDWAVLKHLMTNPIYSFNRKAGIADLDIKDGKHWFSIQCKAVNLHSNDRFELGMDYIMRSGMTLKLDGANLIPSLNGRFVRSDEARYIIEVTIFNESASAVIDLSLTNSIVWAPFAQRFIFEDINAYDFYNSKSLLPVKFNGKTTSVKMSMRNQTLDGKN